MLKAVPLKKDVCHLNRMIVATARARRRFHVLNKSGMVVASDTVFPRVLVFKPTRGANDNVATAQRKKNA